MVSAYEALDGLRHRHGALVHEHPHAGPHLHREDPGGHGHGHGLAPAAAGHGHAHGSTHAAAAAAAGHDHPYGSAHATATAAAHGHSHGLVDPSLKRSRAGLRTVGLSLAVLGLTAIAQLAIFLASGSVALLADLIHNAGDAATALPLAVAFALRSARAERVAGRLVVLAILVSACVAGYEAIARLIAPQHVDHLGALAAAGAIGFLGNAVAARIRTRAGRRLDSPALLADGAHASADAYVSLAVVASAAVLALGLDVADPLIGLAITLVILRITLASWRTVRDG
jgi:Co/Zn/Cd efflux system component